MGRDEQQEIVVHFDYNDESLVLSESEDDEHNPGAYPGEARVEVDPLVEAFARSPYDPVIGAMMMGRATGEVIARPPGQSWMRVIAGILALGMIGQFPITVYFATRSGGSGPILSSPSLAVGLALMLGGLLLAYRLLKHSAR